jgi:GNAT superfamily N-acetyltransferase
MTGLVVLVAAVALVAARRLGAPPGSWRRIVGVAVLVLAASQALPPGHPLRADLVGSARTLGWLALAAAPIAAYALWIRALRRRTGASRPAPHPVGLVQIADDAALVAETEAALATLAAPVLGPPAPLSLAWRAEDGTLAGHLRLVRAARIAEIEALIVAEPFRRRGIGTRLLRAAEAEARSRGLERMAATVGSWQSPGFFASAGYRAAAHHDLGGGVRRIRMERDLA